MGCEVDALWRQSDRDRNDPWVVRLVLYGDNQTGIGTIPGL